MRYTHCFGDQVWGLRLVADYDDQITNDKPCLLQVTKMIHDIFSRRIQKIAIANPLHSIL